MMLIPNKQQTLSAISPAGRHAGLERDVPALVTPDHDALAHHIHARHLFPCLRHLVGSRARKVLKKYFRSGTSTAE